MTFLVRDLGSVPYEAALQLQRSIVQRLQSGEGDEMFCLLEHPHVITMGRNTSQGAVLVGSAGLEARGVSLVHTDRGGDATYHGPGQLVGYPILKLEEGRRDIKRYVHDVEEVLIRTLDELGIDGERDARNRGVWVDGRKIASVGIRISRWVTSHGFALNVSTDLSYFSLIHPCGIVGCEMTTIERELDAPVSMNLVKNVVTRHFANVFARDALTSSPVEKAAGSHE